MNRKADFSADVTHQVFDELRSTVADEDAFLVNTEAFAARRLFTRMPLGYSVISGSASIFALLAVFS